MNQKIRFVVMDENVLGLINPARPDVLEILHASVLRGATAKDLDGWTFLPQDSGRVRPATRADFNEFRVSSEGYARDTERYDFPAH